MWSKLKKMRRRVFTYIYLLCIKTFGKGKLNFSYLVTFDNHVKVDLRKDSSITFEGRLNAKRNSEFRAFHGGHLVISDGCTFNNNCMVACGDEIRIGKGTIFGPNVVVVDHDHDYKDPNGLKSMTYKKGPILIGENVWVGANVVILKNSTIGNNVVIGANCVVSGTIHDNTVLVQERSYIHKTYEVRKG